MCTPGTTFISVAGCRKLCANVILVVAGIVWPFGIMKILLDFLSVLLICAASASVATPEVAPVSNMPLGISSSSAPAVASDSVNSPSIALLICSNSANIWFISSSILLTVLAMSNPTALLFFLCISFFSISFFSTAFGTSAVGSSSNSSTRLVSGDQ